MKEIYYLVKYKCDTCGVEREVPHLTSQKPNGNRKFVCNKFLEMNKKDVDKLDKVETCELRIQEVKDV